MAKTKIMNKLNLLTIFNLNGCCESCEYGFYCFTGSGSGYINLPPWKKCKECPTTNGLPDC